jgi:hypothetical protein
VRVAQDEQFHIFRRNFLLNLQKVNLIPSTMHLQLVTDQLSPTVRHGSLQGMVQRGHQEYGIPGSREFPNDVRDAGHL